MLGETIYNRYVPRPSGREDECNNNDKKTRVEIKMGVSVVSSLNTIRKKQNPLPQRNNYYSSVPHHPTKKSPETQPIDRPS